MPRPLRPTEPRRRGLALAARGPTSHRQRRRGQAGSPDPTTRAGRGHPPPAPRRDRPGADAAVSDDADQAGAVERSCRGSRARPRYGAGPGPPGRAAARAVARARPLGRVTSDFVPPASTAGRSNRCSGAPWEPPGDGWRDPRATSPRVVRITSVRAWSRPGDYDVLPVQAERMWDTVIDASVAVPPSAKAARPVLAGEGKI
jgi:hypothetical protein